MAEMHPEVEFICGDDLIIDGVLLDDDNNSYDLTGATLEWFLINPDGIKVCPTAYVITIDDNDPTNGLITITMTSDATSALMPGRYQDMLRVSVDNQKYIFWEGFIQMRSNPDLELDTCDDEN